MLYMQSLMPPGMRRLVALFSPSRGRGRCDRRGMTRRPLQLVLNGRHCGADVEARTLLAHALREAFGVTSVHIGCDTSQCGACTVLLDGRAVKSCTVLALQAEGARITTVEGLVASGQLHPLQQAFVDHHGLQCGFCTPAMILTATDLLSRDPEPSETAIR